MNPDVTSLQKLRFRQFNDSLLPERRRYLRQCMKIKGNKGRKIYDHSLEWRIRRLIRIEGAGHKCEQIGCETISHLEVNHLSYRNAGDEEYDDLNVLCKKHHIEFTRNNKLLTRHSVPDEKTLNEKNKEYAKIICSIIRR